MKVYLCGPIAGLDPEYVRILFCSAEERLRGAGHEPVNPWRFSTPEEQVEFAALGRDFVKDHRYQELMERCFHEMHRCDVVLMLPGWERSNGATLEHDRAKAVMDVYYDIDLLAPSLKWTGDPECEPKRGYEGDAGFDLYVSKTTMVPYRGFVDVNMGINVELPPGVWGMLTGRSSTLRRRQLLVSQGIIDNGYRGPLFAGVQNFGQGAQKIVRGERIAQLIPIALQAPTMPIVRVDELGESDRGEAAFGSTGN